MARNSQQLNDSAIRVEASNAQAQVADFRADGTADDVEIQAALDALPSSGGKIVLSEGTFTLTSAISRAIDDVTIEGQGASTILNLDASTAVISAGSQAGWLIRDIQTDAG